MNALLHASVSDLWSLAGWTMVHFLWLGAIVAAVATVARVALRSASPNARYAVAIGSLFLLAALPLATAAWLVKYPPPLKAGAGGGIAGPIAQSATAPPIPATANDLIELHTTETPTAPGSAGGDLASGVQPPVASTLPLPSNSRRSRGLLAATAAQPSASPTSFNALIESCVAYLPWLWLIGTPLTFALLVSGVVGTRRLGRSSHAIDSDPIVELLGHLASSLRITRRVTVAVCDRIASPVLIGIIRPMILLPPAAITGWSPDELEMVLLHELAHVRRWDNLVNLLQRCVESLLFFHPAVWLISNWARREREACCDATVVARTNRPHAYAELLVALAAQLPRSVLFHPAASSAMAAGPLRSRIRQILKLEEDPMLVSGKSLALMLGSLLVAATLIVLYVPTIGHADTTAKDDSSSDSKSQKDEYPYKVEFKKGASKFLEGDEITIDEIRGTSKEIKPGNKYRITGKYKLRSHPSASISAYTTAKEAKDGIGPTQSVQSKDITQGEGDFTLILPMGIQGWPHISFYSGGPDFGGIYFGTGDTLLKWWGTEKSTDEAEYAKYPLPAKFFYEVKFEKGESKFLDGDDITINEIRGDAKTFEPGNNYLIQGRYKLHSHPEAQLSAFTTAKEAKDGVGPIQSIQTQKISKGEADFTIILPMTVRGWPHLSFYNTKSGERFGGIYFGTGDSVLKESWAFGKLIEDEKRDSAHSHNSNDTESANDEERTRFEHFEKSLKTIELVIAVFNDSAGYSHQLEPVYNSLAKEHHSLYLWGLKVDAKSPGAERYHLTDAPTCIVFRNGKETSRLAPIKDAEQLKRFIELAAGARKVTVKPDGSVVAEGLESYDANSAPRAAEESAKLIGPFKNIATSPTDASVYKLPAPLQTVFPELPELVKQLKEDPAHPQFAYNLKDSGTTLEVLAPKVVQEQYFEKRLSQWRDSANIPPTPATDTHSSKFPSLEEQKLADLAYKRLGLELEPIEEVDLGRVKALGYDGGVKVASGSAGLGGLEDSMIRQGDILVGLGIWPTTNMKAVGEILARPETADLNPVKFYVVRGETLPVPTGEIPQTRDIVHTGRVEIRNAGSPEEHYSTAPSTSVSGSTANSSPYQTGVLGTFPAPFPTRNIVAQPSVDASPYATPAMKSPIMAHPVQPVHPHTATDPWPGATPAAIPTPSPSLEDSPASVVRNGFTAAAERLEEAMKRKSEAMEKRLQAKDASTIETAKQDLEAANKQLEEAKREFEREKRLQETLDTEKYYKEHDDQRVQPATGTQPPADVWQSASRVPADASSSTPEQVLNAPKANEADAPQKHDSSVLTAPQSHPYDVPKLETTPKYSPTPDPHSNPSADAPRVDSASDGRSSRLARTDSGHSRTSSQSAAKKGEPSSDDRILVAYNIPAELVNDVNNMRNVSDMHGEFGSGGRYFLQATPERQKQFQQLLDAAPKWRDPEAAKLRAKQVYVKTEKDGQEYVEWQPAGLTFTSRANPRFAGPPVSGGGWAPNGVTVAEVAPGSPADWNGIEPGDIMTKAGKFETKSLAELESLLKTQGQDYSTKIVQCLINRNLSGSFYAQLILAITDAQSKPSGPISDSSAAQEQSTNARKTSTPTLAASTDKSALRYDGKTFDEWREMLTNELSTEKRIEAIKALAAFGRAGYGKEASKTILGVAGQYDFLVLEGDQTPEGKLKQVVLDELLPSFRTQSLAQYWVPDLTERLQKEPKKWRSLADNLFCGLYTDDEATLAILQSQAKSADAELSGLALSTLIRCSQGSGTSQIDNDKTRSLIDEALQSRDPATVRFALSALVFPPPSNGGGGGAFGPVSSPPAQLLYRPAMLPSLLFSSDEDVRRQTRSILQLLDEKDVPQVVDQLIAVLKDKSRKRDRIEALRGLAAIGPPAEPAMNDLKTTLASDNYQERIAAATAIKRIVGKDQYQKPVADVLGKELGIKVERSGSGAWGALPLDDASDSKAFFKFTEDVVKEQESLFPTSGEKTPK